MYIIKGTHFTRIAAFRVRMPLLKPVFFASFVPGLDHPSKLYLIQALGLALSWWKKTPLLFANSGRFSSIACLNRVSCCQ